MKQAMLRMVLLFLAAAGVSAPAWGQAKAFDEYQVKAAFLYQFAQFVEWPTEALAGANRSLTFCVLGEDPSNGALEATLKNKTIKGLAVRVAYRKEPPSKGECQVLFASSSEKKRWSRLPEESRSMPILTVGEGAEFIEAGGMIALITEQNRIRFEINLAAGEKAGLRLSSKLLALAKVVHVSKPSGGK